MESKEKFKELSEEATEAAEKCAADYLISDDVVKIFYVETEYQDLYAVDGHTVYDANNFEPIGRVFDVKSRNDENYKSYVFIKFSDIEDLESAYAECVNFAVPSPYGFIPDGMYLCYSHNGNYSEWFYTHHPHGGLIDLCDIDEYMAAFNGEYKIYIK